MLKLNLKKAISICIVYWKLNKSPFGKHCENYKKYEFNKHGAQKFNRKTLEQFERDINTYSTEPDTIINQNILELFTGTRYNPGLAYKHPSNFYF